MKQSRLRQMDLAEFVVKCSSLIDEVEVTGRPILVTKDGIAIARLEQFQEAEELPKSGARRKRQKTKPPIRKQ